MHPSAPPRLDPIALAADIKRWGRELGFAALGITDVDLSAEEPHLLTWLRRGFQGDMHYMGRHGLKRCRPEQLVPGTLRVICVRLDYLPPGQAATGEPQSEPGRAVISRYALGRDYHKLMRRRLQRLAARIEEAAGSFGYRAFADSAPVLEKALARKAGLGWIGKNTLLLSREAGSYFFLGELFTDLPLPVDEPVQDHCGSCRACLAACPTGAIVGPYQLDARRCISYLTIESHEPIPEPLRPLIGNRVFGCDDCQISCPWNKFAQVSNESDFSPRHGLDQAQLVELFGWSEQTFLARTEGSAIRRLGHERWLRNLAVALGNGEPSEAAMNALTSQLGHPSELVREHASWALEQLRAKAR